MTNQTKEPSLKLSQAIQKGMQDLRHVEFEYIKLDKTNNPIGCCTLGGAAIGALGLESAVQIIRDDGPDCLMTALHSNFPILHSKDSELVYGYANHFGLYDCQFETLGEAMVAVNDAIKPSPEEIVKKLEAMGL